MHPSASRFFAENDRLIFIIKSIKKINILACLCPSVILHSWQE